MNQSTIHYPVVSPCETPLISHNAEAEADTETETETEIDSQLLAAIKTRLCTTGSLPGATVEQQLTLLAELSAFALGRFLLNHRGLNAYWTHRIVTWSPEQTENPPIPALEHFILARLPAVLATRERFGIFRRQLQNLLRPGLSLASVPCGLMGELLLLDYHQYTDITLTGVDLDSNALHGAWEQAKIHGLADRLSLHCADAFALNMYAEVDILTSNGLNIYEHDDARVTELYRRFFNALKPGGKLITSFLTPPPSSTLTSPWNFAAIDKEALTFQQLLFSHLIGVKWGALRTHTQTSRQLADAGFTDITFINDSACMFPTVIAQKPQ